MKILPLLSMLLALILLIGCAGPTITPQPDGTTAYPVPSESADTAVSEDGEVILVDEPSDFQDCRPLIDGLVRFEKDSSRRASVNFPADGTEQSVFLEDANGLTWKLVIPADALDHPQKITMTAMKDINSDMGKISGGVVLSPDGLRFSAPVTLTVKGAGIEASGLLFLGNGEGGNLELPIANRGMDSVEMKLFHFSTAYASDDQAILEELAESAQGSIRKLSALAKQILNRPIEAPVPPAIPIKCHHDTEDKDEEKIKKYLKDFGKPEIDLVNALLAAKTTIEATGGESPDFTLELRLVKRLLKKGTMLIRQYKGQEDMFYAVAAATLSAERQSALLGESLSDDQSFMPVLADWAQSIAEKYLSELIKNHEYKNIHPLLKLTRSTALLGGTGATKLTERVLAACTFTLRFEGTSTQKRDSVATWGTSGECKLSLSGSNEGGLVFESTAKGTHDSYTSSDPSAAQVLLTKEFDTEVYLLLEPTCYLSGRAGIARLGADELTYQTDDGPITVPSFYNLVDKLVLGKYYDAGLQAVMIEIALTSGEAVIEKVIDGTYEYTTIVYTISLEHTPQ